MVEKFQEKVNPDWEHAFDRFESVIASGSEAMRLEVLTKLSSLSKLAPEHVLARAIPILARLLGDDTSNNSRPVQEAAAYCLYRIACRGEGRIAIEIGQSGAVLSILRFLPHSDNGFQRILVKCLWGFVTFGTENRVDVARNGGLETIIDMLKSGTDDDTRRYLLEIFSALTLLREVRRIIASLGGLGFLVEAASCGSMVSRERACQAIGLLGVTRRGRCMLFELGVIPVLVELFRDGDIKTKLVAGNSLGIISSHVSHIRLAAQAGAIPLYAGLLQGPEPLGKEIAEDVLCILAVAEPNAVVIVEHLVRILREGDDEAKAAAADVLWDLSGYKHSVSVVRNSGAIPILVDLLSDRSVEVKEKVSGAIAQLSYDEAHRLALADTGAIQVLIELLHDESEELKDNAAEALINFSEDPLQRDRVSEALDVPSFQSMQNRMVHIRASDERTVRSMRWMSIEQLSRNLDLV